MSTLWLIPEVPDAIIEPIRFVEGEVTYALFPEEDHYILGADFGGKRPEMLAHIRDEGARGWVARDLTGAGEVESWSLRETVELVLASFG